MRLLLGVVLALSFFGCATTPRPTRPIIIDDYNRIIYMDASAASQECWNRGGTAYGVTACYDERDNVIVLPHDAPEWVLNHELCHRLGWKADHSGARPEGCR